MRSPSCGLFLSLVVLSACQQDSAPASNPAGLSYRADDGEISSPEDLLKQDLGTGILHLAESPGGSRARADTLPIHRAPDPRSEVQAAFVFQQPDPNAWSYSVLSRQPGLVSNVLEFAYEESGLPLDSIHPNGWVRVVYARNPAGQFQKGWIAPDSRRVAHVLWKDQLRERSLYFHSPADQALYSAPGGERLPIRFEGADYELIPIRVEREWMEVRVQMPSMCGAQPGAELKERIGWIRYLDSDGRPRVWYHPRGC